MRKGVCFLNVVSRIILPNTVPASHISLFTFLIFKLSIQTLGIPSICRTTYMGPVLFSISHRFRSFPWFQLMEAVPVIDHQASLKKGLRVQCDKTENVQESMEIFFQPYDFPLRPIQGNMSWSCSALNALEIVFLAKLNLWITNAELVKI